MSKENLHVETFESQYGNGYSIRLLDSRSSLINTLNQTPIWQVNERHGISQTIEGIDRMLSHLAQLEERQEAQGM